MLFKNIKQVKKFLNALNKEPKQYMFSCHEKPVKNFVTIVGVFRNESYVDFGLSMLTDEMISNGYRINSIRDIGLGTKPQYEFYFISLM